MRGEPAAQAAARPRATAPAPADLGGWPRRARSPRRRGARRGPASSARPRPRRTAVARARRDLAQGSPRRRTRWTGRASRTSLARTTPTNGLSLAGSTSRRRDPRLQPGRQAPRSGGVDLDRVVAQAGREVRVLCVRPSMIASASDPVPAPYSRRTKGSGRSRRSQRPRGPRERGTEDRMRLRGGQEVAVAARSGGLAR